MIKDHRYSEKLIHRITASLRHRFSNSMKSTTIYKTIALLSLFTFTSCGIYTNFEKPEQEIKNQYGSEVAVQDTLVPLPTWRAFFSDTLLVALIDSALVNNTDMLIAKHNIDQAQASLLASKLAYVPSFALAPQGGVNHLGGSNAFPYSLPINMQWEIDLFGKNRNRKRMAEAALFQTEEYVKLMQTQIVASVANSYYTLILLDEQLAIATQSANNQEKNLEIMTEMKEAGMQTEAAVNQATSNYLGVKASGKDIENQIKVVENGIALLINTAPQRIERAQFSSSELYEEKSQLIEQSTHFLSSNLLENIALESLSNRADVKIAEHQLSQSFYNVNLARAAFYPSIGISATGGWTNNGGTILNPGAFLLSAIGSLTQPIFASGALKANLKIAKSQYEQSVLQFSKTLLVAGNEVSAALAQCQNSADKLTYREGQVAAGVKAVVNSTELMMNSSSTYLDVLYAENALLESKLLQAADWFEGIQGRINLYKALGGGAEPEPKTTEKGKKK